MSFYRRLRELSTEEIKSELEDAGYIMGLNQLRNILHKGFTKNKHGGSRRNKALWTTLNNTALLPPYRDKCSECSKLVRQDGDSKAVK